MRLKSYLFKFKLEEFCFLGVMIKIFEGIFFDLFGEMIRLFFLWEMCWEDGCLIVLNLVDFLEVGWGVIVSVCEEGCRFENL